jgi:phosphoribosylformylglycinamidine synthase I
MAISKPKILILSGYGLNCEEETKFAFDKVGGKADIMHINDLILSPHSMLDYDVLAFPGGFSYCDDTGSGKAFSNKFKNHLKTELEDFLKRDTLMIGICNGFQIMTSLGILPGALAHNKGGKYMDRWVDMKVVGKSPWLLGIKNISLPIAHGEGQYIISKKEYAKMKGRKEIALTYTKGDVSKFQNLDANPNGAMYDIAGVLAYNGRAFGLMPHPDRALFNYQNPLWSKERSKKKTTNKDGDGLQIFKNAIKYFKK